MSNQFWVRLGAAFMLLLALVSAVLAWRAAVIGYGPLPFWDQWERVTPAQEFLRLLEPHNEHRVVLPAFFFMLDGLLFGGKNIFLLVSIQVIQALHVALFIWLARRADVGGAYLTACGAFAAALLFCGAQVENFYWGFQVQFVLVFLLATASLATAAFSPPRIRYDALGFCLALGAAFTLSAGLLVAPAAAALCVLMRAGWRRTGVFACAALIAVMAYALGYEATPGHSDPVSSITHPVDVFYYALVYLGAPFGDAIAHGPLTELAPSLADPVAASKWVGALGLGALVLVAPLVLLGSRSRSGLVVLAVCGVLVCVAFLTALGRWQLGAHQAMASRYATPVMIYWAALYLLAAMELLPRFGRFHAVAAAGWMLAGLTALIVLVGNWPSWTALAASQGERMRIAESAVLVGVTDESVLTGVYPIAAKVMEQSVPMADAGLSVFGRREHAWLGRELPDLEPTFEAACIGAFDVLSAVGGEADQRRAQGWAWSTTRREPIDRLLLVDESGVVAGIAYGGRPRPDVQEVVAEVSDVRTGWIGHAYSNGQRLTAFAAPRGRDLRLCRIGER